MEIKGFVIKNFVNKKNVFRIYDEKNKSIFEDYEFEKIQVKIIDGFVYFYPDKNMLDYLPKLLNKKIEEFAVPAKDTIAEITNDSTITGNGIVCKIGAAEFECILLEDPHNCLKNYAKRKCFICEKLLEEPNYHINKFKDTVGIIYDATIWRSIGNYGSAKFDPIGTSEFLETYICDNCLVAKKHLVYHVKNDDKLTVSFFNPE